MYTIFLYFLIVYYLILYYPTIYCFTMYVYTMYNIHKYLILIYNCFIFKYTFKFKIHFFKISFPQKSCITHTCLCLNVLKHQNISSKRGNSYYSLPVLNQIYQEKEHFLTQCLCCTCASVIPGFLTNQTHQFPFKTRLCCRCGLGFVGFTTVQVNYKSFFDTLTIQR